MYLAYFVEAPTKAYQLEINLLYSIGGKIVENVFLTLGREKTYRTNIESSLYYRN